MSVLNFLSRNEIIMNEQLIFFTTADEFLICYAARDWSVTVRSVSRYGSTKERKCWFEYKEIFSIGFLWIRIHIRDVEKKVPEVKHTFEYLAPGRDKAWPSNTLGAQEAEGDIQQLTPTPENNTEGLGEQRQNINGVPQRYLQKNTEVSTLPTSEYQFSAWETRETIPRTWSSKVSLLSNFAQRMSRFELARIETTDKTKSPWGGLTVTPGIY